MKSTTKIKFAIYYFELASAVLRLRPRDTLRCNQGNKLQEKL